MPSLVFLIEETLRVLKDMTALGTSQESGLDVQDPGFIFAPFVDMPLLFVTLGERVVLMVVPTRDRLQGEVIGGGRDPAAHSPVGLALPIDLV